MERGRPVRGRDSTVGVGEKQRSERQRIGEQKQPHPDLLRIGAEQRRLIGINNPMVDRNIGRGLGLLLLAGSYLANSNNAKM